MLNCVSTLRKLSRKINILATRQKDFYLSWLEKKILISFRVGTQLYKRKKIKKKNTTEENNVSNVTFQIRIIGRKLNLH